MLENLVNGWVERHAKKWGYEIWMANNGLYCGKILHLWEGRMCSLHFHKLKDETFYLFRGKVLLEVEDEKTVLHEGESVHIPIGTKHRFGGLQESDIIEISTQHFETDSYRLSESGGEISEEDMKR